ncbi:MAG: DUF4102 domain-containing protein [Rhizobiales bacterium]|nr:DUF4102 domain-containing protein [Hyphomicrobiales bacterium]
MSATTAFRGTPSCRDFPRWRPPTSTPFAGVFTAESQTGFVRGLQKMWERIRAKADLDEDTFRNAPPRDTEYTIWLDGMSSFGLRIRPSGAKSYIVMFRIRGNRRPYRLTLGKATDIPFDTAKRMAKIARMEALAGNDPRGVHKSGELLKRAKI